MNQIHKNHSNSMKQDSFGFNWTWKNIEILKNFGFSEIRFSKRGKFHCTYLAELTVWFNECQGKRGSLSIRLNRIMCRESNWKFIRFFSHIFDSILNRIKIVMRKRKRIVKKTVMLKNIYKPAGSSAGLIFSDPVCLGSNHIK